jgi:hypothetical protein
MSKRSLLYAIGITSLIYVASGLFEVTNKYEEGDYITPTDPSWSWYGQVAYVNGWGEHQGHTGYLLTFFDPETRTFIRPGVFHKSVESQTIKTKSPLGYNY